MKIVKSLILLIIGSFLAFLAFVTLFLKNPVYTHSDKSVFDQVSVSRLTSHVEYLAEIIPPRNFSNTDSLDKAAKYISDELRAYGYKPRYQDFSVARNTYKNVIAHIGAKEKPVIVAGAHYDVFENTPGADDNASGVAGLLEVARLLKQNEDKIENNLELVFFTLEEPPAFRTSNMGSFHHSKSLVEAGREVELMVSVEMIGYFDERPGSQAYPISLLSWWFGKKGNFIALIGKTSDWMMMRKVKKIFSSYADLPVNSLNAPRALHGIDFSDHLNYWNLNLPAIMISDTAFLRNHNYHKLSDTPDKLNYTKMAHVVSGIYGTLKDY